MKIVIACMCVSISFSFGLRSPIQLRSSYVSSKTSRLGVGMRQYGCGSSGCSSSECSNSQSKAFQLVLVRHGESEWNKLNKFTGWYDCPLSEKGHKEAASAGQQLAKEGFAFDVAFTSFLKRAIRTCWHTLEATDSMNAPIHQAWQLNERHYGALQGLDKQETVAKYGSDQVALWRRSYDIPPPPCDEKSEHCPKNNPRYANIPDAAAVRCESLKTTLDRVVPYWVTKIAPVITSGKKVIIAAHGNSLRALVKYLDDIPNNEITEVNIPTAVPLVYDLDANLRVIPHPDAIGPLKGRYVGNQQEIRDRIQGVKNQTK